MGGTIAEGAGGGGGCGPHVCEVWWAGVQWEAQRIKKSDHHLNRETRGEEEKQKNDQKKEKIRPRDKKQKKLGRTLPRPHSLPKRPLGLPFGP